MNKNYDNCTANNESTIQIKFLANSISKGWKKTGRYRKDYTLIY